MLSCEEIFPVAIRETDGNYHRLCEVDHYSFSSRLEYMEQKTCPAMLGTIRNGEWQKGARPCGQPMIPGSIIRMWDSDEDDE